MDTPPPIPRPTAPDSERWFKLIYWSCAVLVVVILANQSDMRPIGKQYGVFELVASLVFLGWAWLIAMLGYRYGMVLIGRRFLAPSAAFVCPHCHYPLRGLPDAGLCPECGTPYSRADISAYWQQHFGIMRSFPRNTPARLKASAVPPPLEPFKLNLAARHPWQNATIKNAMEKMETATRAAGYKPPRMPTFAAQANFGLPGLDRPFPFELSAFYDWIDVRQWSHLLNQSPANPKAGAESVATFGAFESMTPDAIMFLPPSAVRRVPLPEMADEAPGTVIAIEQQTRIGNRAPTRDIGPIEIADTAVGAPIIYCLGRCEQPAGTIIVNLPGHPTPIWLADSLASWLVRLTLCNGIEPALTPEAISHIPEPTRSMYLEEFRKHNPTSTLFPQT